MSALGREKSIAVSEAICGIFINEKSKILLLKRAPTRTYNKNAYDLMGGDIVPGETPLQTFVKDAKEKLDIQLDQEKIEVCKVKNIHYPNQTVKTYLFTYRLNSETPIKLNPKKYQDYGWYNPSQIKQLNLSPKVRDVLIDVGFLQE